MLLKRNLRLFYGANFLLILAQSLPHSILTVLLLAKGLSLSQIMFLAGAFSLAVLLFELPSGIWADLYSRKMLYFLSGFLLIIDCAFILFFDNFYILALAWFIYGIGIALSSDTLETALINAFKRLENAKNHIESFYRYKNQMQFSAMLLGAVLGSFLYFLIGVKIYLLGISFIVLALFLCLFFKEERLKIQQKSPRKHLLLALRELKKNQALRWLFLLALCSQIFFQSHYQLWQALFLEKALNEKYLFLLYVAFQILGVLVLFKTKPLSCIKLCFFALFLLPFLFFKLYYALFGYMLFVGIFIYLDYRLNSAFSLLVSKRRISVLMAAKSSFSRICALGVLGCCALLLQYFSVSFVIFMNFFLVSVLMLILLTKGAKCLTNPL
ncbi:MFS transporter [Campylobacter sp. VTCC 70190]|uniref:MFS transporter n=1 Tax=Campylobacter sp. VTCC 70190 TaxID=3392118 RepID=UPI00398F175E